MDPIDKFLKLYSYKFDKGYPDMNDEQDILLMETILKEELGFKLKLKEQDDYNDSIYADELDNIKLKISNQNPEGYNLSHIKKDTSKKFQIYIKDVGGTARKLRTKILNRIIELFPNNNVEVLPITSKQGPAFEMDVKGDRVKFEVKGTGAQYSTGTTEKESLVVFFYNSPVKNQFTSKSLVEEFPNLYNDRKKYYEGLDSTSKSSLETFLSSYNADIEKAANTKSALVSLNDPLSSALLIKKSYPGEKLIRNKELKTVKDEGASLANISDVDKYNPADIMVKLKPQIVSFSEALNSDQAIQPVTIFNRNFVNKWGGKTNFEGEPASFVNISLKAENAQGGKGKGYLKQFDPSQWDGSGNKIKGSESYNMTDEEKNLNDDELRDAIEELQLKILSNSGDVKYNPDSAKKIQGRERLISKYASLKLLSFIVIEVALGSQLTVSNALAALSSYAASLTGVNPTFFKITGNPSGEAKIDTFMAESSATLKNNSKLEIQDNSTNGSIQVPITIVKIDPSSNSTNDLKFTLNIRSNGSTQNTVELIPSK